MQPRIIEIAEYTRISAKKLYYHRRLYISAYH